MIHRFQEDLEYSQSASEEGFWSAVYGSAFPGCVSVINNRKNPAQYAGIDRTITLPSGSTIYIDEKKRRDEYSDFLLEVVANDKTGAPGWIEKDLLIDYLAYAFMPSRRCYLFPWLLLKRAWAKWGDRWKAEAKANRAGFRTIWAENPGYKTWSITVPEAVLKSTITEAMIVQL